MFPFLTLALSTPANLVAQAPSEANPPLTDANTEILADVPPRDVQFGILAGTELIAEKLPPSQEDEATEPEAPVEAEVEEKVPETIAPQEIFRPQEVRPLPNTLDDIPVFNSNSPELVFEPGILLSTFPATGMADPDAHLDYAFNGRFDIFAHHVAKAPSQEALRTVYLGIVAYNPSDRPVVLDFLEGASYMSQPDAPFIKLPTYVPNPYRQVYAGPGSRVTDEVLRDHLESRLPLRKVLQPGQYQLLLNVPLLFGKPPNVEEFPPLINGRSTYIRLNSNGDLHLASLTQHARMDEEGFETPPTLTDWTTQLTTGQLGQPRDIAASPPETEGTPFYYGRVSGVSQGSQWAATLTDPDQNTLAIPPMNRPFSYGLSLLDRGTLGTGQVQSVPMIRRYSDTAYRAHGNYGLEYRLTLPLVNNTRFTRTVTVALETPIKQDNNSGGLRFFEPTPDRVFFRGTVETAYTDDRGQPQTEYTHLVQYRGQQGEPLVTLNLRPGEQRLVEVSFLYPPDSTPPQVLTVQTVR